MWVQNQIKRTLTEPQGLARVRTLMRGEAPEPKGEGGAGAEAKKSGRWLESLRDCATGG